MRKIISKANKNKVLQIQNRRKPAKPLQKKGEKEKRSGEDKVRVQLIDTKDKRINERIVV